MTLPIGFLICLQELLLFVQRSSDSGSLLPSLYVVCPGLVPGTNAGVQVGDGCLVHFVILRQPAPARYRRGYAQSEGFDANVFEQIVAPTIQDRQQLADCRTRLQQGDYLIIKPRPREEWDTSSGSSSSSASGGSPPDHSTLLAMHPMNSQTHVVHGSVKRVLESSVKGHTVFFLSCPDNESPLSFVFQR
jgi:hypothetical protein